MFASPLRLNLRIPCTQGTPVRKSLDIWPTFPIVIVYPRFRNGRFHDLESTDEDNVIAALEHNSRVCELRLEVTGAQLGRIATVMQQPFPALTYLVLRSKDRNVQVLPGQFFGRSVPCLRQIELHGIPFPALPMLLLSASDLTALTLHGIPQTGYISPEAMVASLATLTRLSDLSIGFRSPKSRPDEIRLPPTTRTVLPALTHFEFRGVCEYLDDLAARIDAPRLDAIRIAYLNQLVDFEVPQVSRIIDHSEVLKPPMDCSLLFEDDHVFFWAVPSETPKSDDPQSYILINVSILCEGKDWQIAHLTMVLSQISIVSSNVVNLAIDADADLSPLIPQPEDEDIDDIDWLQFLSLFSSVQRLGVATTFSGHISRALEVIADRMMATEVLPALDTLTLQGQSVSSVDKFITARRDSGRPVTVVDARWNNGEESTVRPI